MNEKELYSWQKMTGICLRGVKTAHGPWTIRAAGWCPQANRSIEEEGIGETFGEAMSSLLENMKKLLTDLK